MTKEFCQSRHRRLIYTVFVYLLAAFIALWADVLMVGRIREMTPFEIAAIFLSALGIAFIFWLIFSATERKTKIILQEEGLIFVRGARRSEVLFSDIVSVRSRTGLVAKIFAIVKVEVETRADMIDILLSGKDAEEFFESVPMVAASEAEDTDSDDRVGVGKEKYLSMLSSFVKLTAWLALVLLSTLPVAVVIVGSWSRSGYYVLGVLAVYLVFLIGYFAKHIYAYIHYADYKVEILSQEVRISFGKLSRTENSLYYDSILSFRLRQGFVERLFGLYKISVETKQKAKGLSDHDYFPFLMTKENAMKLASAFEPDFSENVELKKIGGRRIVPYLEKIIVPMIGILILSIFLTPWALFLCFAPLITILLLHLNQGYGFREEHAVFCYGVWTKNIAVIRYDNIAGITASENFSAKKFSLTGLEISMGRYTQLYGVGYIERSDFFEFAEKPEKKVDKEL